MCKATETGSVISVSSDDSDNTVCSRWGTTVLDVARMRRELLACRKGRMLEEFYGRPTRRINTTSLESSATKKTAPSSPDAPFGRSSWPEPSDAFVVGPEDVDEMRRRLVGYRKANVIAADVSEGLGAGWNEMDHDRYIYIGDVSKI